MSEIVEHMGKPVPAALIEARERSHIECALVTGGSGYIGSRLVERLVADGWRVHVILRPLSSLNLLGSCVNKLAIHLHDGSMGDMLNIVAAAKPDVVFHLAAMATADHRPEVVDQMVLSNVLYSTQLVEGMIRNGVRNLVTTETFWQYREGSDDYDPVCLYAATKQAFHDILRYYVKSGDIRAISLVLFDTYGPGDPRKKLFNILKQAARENQTIDMTPGEQIVDMTHVDDVVGAYTQAAELLLSGKIGTLETYAVTSGRRMTLKELVELAVRETGVSIHPNWGGRPYRKNEVMVPWLGKPLPGWGPKIDLEAGIREIFSEP
jgi:nucleoside-diphosphate-sugar epimerase